MHWTDEECIFYWVGQGEFTVMPDSEIYSTDCYRSFWQANTTFSIIN